MRSFSSIITQWVSFTFVLTIVTAADIGVIALHSFGYVFHDASSVVPVLSSTLTAAASTALQFERVLVAVFIYRLAKRHDDLYWNLAKLLCILHAALVKNFSRVWDFIRSYPHFGNSLFSRLRLINYGAILVQALFFAGGSFLLFYNGVQDVWGLPTLMLWWHFVCFLLIDIRFRQHGLGGNLNRLRRMQQVIISTSTGLLGFGAVTSTALVVVGCLKHWYLLFIAQFMFLQAMSLSAAARPLVSYAVHAACERDLDDPTQLGSVKIASRKSPRSLPPLDTKNLTPSRPRYPEKAKLVLSPSLDTIVTASSAYVIAY
ncbi:hypothetical protein FRB90_003711 [Tulasnella sp. 427]|nr:hypothetical protein FRB90_003711 [Tulasnella sp. 427]